MKWIINCIAIVVLAIDWFLALKVNGVFNARDN